MADLTEVELEAVKVPIVEQPQVMQNMQAPTASSNSIPPGLEYLVHSDQLLLHQQVEILEVITGIETCNMYQIKNSLGQLVYTAAEESNWCSRQCIGSRRGFVMHIVDNLKQEVMRVKRVYKLCAKCNCCANINCCAMEIRVEAPVGQTIGYVKQQKGCTKANYVIFDANMDPVLRIEGPACMCSGNVCPTKLEYQILSLEGGQQLGRIAKHWAGLIQESFTNADLFGVIFPMDLEVKCKATVLAATFLIDFMYFESSEGFLWCL